MWVRVNTGLLAEWRGSQGFCVSDFRSRGYQSRPGHPLLFLMPVPVLVVEGVLLILVIVVDIGYWLSGWWGSAG